jgi:dUTP pyrophosphatase
MNVKIKRIDTSLPLPEYQTLGAVGFDMYSRVDAEFAPNELKKLPSNFVIQVPEGHVLILAARSSLGTKRGLQLVNSIGIIDQDFCGPADEIKISLRNFTKENVFVKRGERLIQGLILPVTQAKWEEINEIDAPTRGGFGSTGEY